jgi:hypothetical protein
MLSNIEINNQMHKVTVSFDENMEDSYASVIVHSVGLPEKSFEFDLKKNQIAIDAYPRLKDKAESLLDRDKTKTLYRLLTDKDNCSARKIGNWVRTF